MIASVAVIVALTIGAGPGPEPSRPEAPRAAMRVNTPVDGPSTAPSLAEAIPVPRKEEVLRTSQTVALYGLLTLAPVAVLMVSAFVRISIVLTLLRQALGSPQVPGNQVLMALALMLTALVMAPQAEAVYARGIAPFAAGRASPAEAWEAGTGPIKDFMLDQIRATKHEDYLVTLYDCAVPPGPGRVEPAYAEQIPLRVVAPAFLLSELTTALVIGFAIYLPFLVIDLVVSAVLAAMGLVMLPPALVATPLKLILFVLADGWMLVAEMLLRSFAAGPGAG